MISPQRDMLQSAIRTLGIITSVPVFDLNAVDSNKYPQMIVSTGQNINAERAKNEQRSMYTLYVDYFDDVDDDHGLMLDTLFSIREYLKYLRLSNYNCQSYAFNQSSEMIDNSTSKSLRHVTITFDYHITEKLFI